MLNQLMKLFILRTVGGVVQFSHSVIKKGVMEAILFRSADKGLARAFVSYYQKPSGYVTVRMCVHPSIPPYPLLVWSLSSLDPPSTYLECWRNYHISYYVLDCGLTFELSFQMWMSWYSCFTGNVCMSRIYRSKENGSHF